MSNVTVSAVTIGIRWWLLPWVFCALVIHRATGWRPSETAIQRVAMRAVYVRGRK